MPPLPSDWANTNGPSHCTGSFSQGTPEDADLHLSIAHALKTLGRRQEAIESYRTGGGLSAGLWRCVLESRQPQNLPLHG